MSAPDPDELARKTLELWQDQLAALAGDPETGSAMVKLMSLAALGPAAAMRAFAEAGGGSVGTDGAAGGERQAGAVAAGSTAVAAASGAGDDRLARLERRLDELERRLAELERPARRARGGTGGGRGKARSSTAR
jgi:hypothetical protein